MSFKLLLRNLFVTLNSFCYATSGLFEKNSSDYHLLCIKLILSIPDLTNTGKAEQNISHLNLIWTKIVPFFTLFSLLSRGCPGIFRNKTGQAVKIQSEPVPWQNIKTLSMSWPGFLLAVPARPIMWQGLDLVTLSFVPGQWRIFCPFFLKSCTVPFRWKL